jgi:hypothetical protein
LEKEKGHAGSAAPPGPKEAQMKGTFENQDLDDVLFDRLKTAVKELSDEELEDLIVKLQELRANRLKSSGN